MLFFAANMYYGLLHASGSYLVITFVTCLRSDGVITYNARDSCDTHCKCITHDYVNYILAEYGPRLEFLRIMILGT